MNRRYSFLWLLVPVALLALLLVGMTTTSVVGHHHHHDGTTEARCPICHLSHQPMDAPTAANHAQTFALIAPAAEPREVGLISSPEVRRVPARAPPTA
jgi:hypothetical protein